MSELVINEEVKQSYLDMSDEEMMNLSSAAVTEPALEVPSTTSVADTVENVSNAVEDTADVEESTEEVTTKEDVDNAAPVDIVNTEPVEVSDTTASTVDYKAEYDRLLTPFKANGRDIAVSNVDDAIALMQMGANYNKKMAALKPNLKLMKLLENNGLLNEERLSFLIDLEKKNPEAISKLVKESGLDPLDLDSEKASGYKPQTYTVDDREIELDTVLDELQSTPTYNRTLDIVSNKWDGPSKQIIANQPQLLKVINAHVQSGVYDTIISEIEKERVFGRLQGLSDLEAYRQVGDAIQARGGFASVEQQAPAKPVVVTPKPKSVEDDRLKDKKRAASSTKPAIAASTAKDFNPLSMSDEEFSKQVNKKFL